MFKCSMGPGLGPQGKLEGLCVGSFNNCFGKFVPFFNRSGKKAIFIYISPATSNEHEMGELLAKNITRTAGRQLDGRHLLFGEYLRGWTTLYLLNLPINMHCQRRT